MQHPYYVIWTGSLNLGDSVGVFNDAAFCGLLVQMPFTVTFLPQEDEPKAVIMLLTTSEVEIFNDPQTGEPLIHPIFLDWVPGEKFPEPVGQIDAEEIVEGHPEVHEIVIPVTALRPPGSKHTITVLVNPKAAAGLKDDFVINRFEVGNEIGAKIGW